jgi:hypothetical protein
MLPSATLIIGAWPELNKAGTANIPHNPKKDAVILYLLIVSAKGPNVNRISKLRSILGSKDSYQCTLKFVELH